MRGASHVAWPLSQYYAARFGAVSYTLSQSRTWRFEGVRCIRCFSNVQCDFKLWHTLAQYRAEERQVSTGHGTACAYADRTTNVSQYRTWHSVRVGRQHPPPVLWLSAPGSSIAVSVPHAA
eukprot:2978902-Rhodomonas_salina.1